jgi:hypothetical protein
MKAFFVGLFYTENIATDMTTGAAVSATPRRVLAA